MRKYGAISSTTPAVQTTPWAAITGGTTIRVRLYDLVVGSDAVPADAAAKFNISRESANGTTATTQIGNALDGSDAASAAIYTTSWTTTSPTVTANSALLQWAQNQRATFRWVAAPDSELAVPASAGAGLVLLNTTLTASGAYAFSFMWME